MDGGSFWPLKIPFDSPLLITPAGTENSHDKELTPQAWDGRLSSSPGTNGASHGFLFFPTCNSKFNKIAISTDD